MKLLASLVYFVTFGAFAQTIEQRMLTQLEKQNLQAIKVIDVADAVSSFYRSNDLAFMGVTYVALSCAEKMGQETLRRLAEEILRPPAKGQLERSVSDIIVRNDDHKKGSAQIATEYSQETKLRIREFYRLSILRISASPEAVECFLSRTN